MQSTGESAAMRSSEAILSSEHNLNDRLLNAKGQLRSIAQNICGPIPSRDTPAAVPTSPSVAANTFITQLKSVQAANSEILYDISNIIDWLRENFGDGNPLPGPVSGPR